MRKLAPRILLLLGGILLALLSGEVLVRVFWDDLRPLEDVDIEYPMGFPAPVTGLPFGLIPGSVFVGRYDGDPYGTLPDDHTIRYTVNEMGFRDRDFGRVAGAEEMRVLVVGDSFAFGEGVAREDRFTAILGAALSESRGEPVVTLNCAVSGYSSRDEAELLPFVVPRLNPDLVVVGYCLNDPVHLTEDEYPVFDLIMLRDLGVEADPSRESWSYLLRFVRGRLGVRRVSGMTLDWYRGLYDGPRSAWVMSRIYLAEMRDVARENGAEFAVAIQPIFFQVGGDYPLAGAHREIREWCGRQSIPVIDLQPFFAGMSAEDLVVHPKDHHPNAKAHAIMGKAIAEFLDEEVIKR